MKKHTITPLLVVPVLVTTNDTSTGARHVKWLNRITVQKVE